jgi:uncharacterized protein
LTEIQIWELAAIFAVVAMFYTAVGHAGASGYLAAMALVGVLPDVMRPTALTLNIVIAAYTTWRFRNARFFDAKIVGAFLLGAAPLAFIGGGIALPAGTYRVLVGAVLLFSSLYLIWRAFTNRFADSAFDESQTRIPLIAAPFIGAAIGLLSGLTGTGGGIFLSPLILLLSWAGPKTTAGIAAPFIMVNSAAGLAGGLTMGTFAIATIPNAVIPLAVAALMGAFLGTWLGIYKLSNRLLLVTLAMVMLVAAAKLLGLT